MRRLDCRVSAIVLAGVVVLSAACAAPTHARSAPTPTATATYLPTYTPVPPRPGLISLSLPVTATSVNVVPSPDGSLIAVITMAQPNVMTLYDLQGQAQGSYALPTDAQPVVAWAPNSSGLLVWAMYGNPHASGPLVLLDRQARAVAAGLSGTDAALSPDGAWIAFTDFPDTYIPYNNVVGDVKVAPRRGGSARMLAHNAIFLGWQSQRMVYYATGSIFAISPEGGNAVWLAAAPDGNVLQPPFGGPASSPDGEVLLFDGFHYMPYLLVGTQVRQPPLGMSEPYRWVGGHDVLAVLDKSQNVYAIAIDFQIVDITTGALVRDTGITVSDVTWAVAGDWILWTDAASDIHLVNFQTKATHDIGPEPFDGNFLRLGPGRFLLTFPRQTQAYIIDPAQAR